MIELASIFIEIFESKNVLPGTCILMGSLSYLASVGASLYGAEWRVAVNMINRR